MGKGEKLSTNCNFLVLGWMDVGEAYSLSNERKTATRSGEGLTRVIYSDGNSYTAGDTLIFHILDAADVSPGDGLAIVVNDSDEESCNRPGAIFINTYGIFSSISSLSFYRQSQSFSYIISTLHMMQFQVLPLHDTRILKFPYMPK